MMIGAFLLFCLLVSAATQAQALRPCVSYGEYAANADYLSPERAQGLADCIGAQPWGEGLKTWFANSPGFNLDKIKVPVLMEEHDPISLIYGWDAYALLPLQHKPIDLLYMRDGGHVLSKPRERFVSQEMNADWFDFWLNGHEDPDPYKSKQYERWRSLKGH